MPDSTLYINAKDGKIFIKDYSASDTPSSLAALSKTDPSVRFHSDYEFITIRGSVSQASISLPSFTRGSHSWSSGGKCFITTAAVEILGLGDDDHVLETLRTYRDGYMQESEEGRELVKEYYEIAPSIVEAIDESETPIAIYAELFNKYILEAKLQIDNGENEKALQTYKSMVEYAKSYLGE